MAVLDRFLTKTLETSGTSTQSPTGVIADGGSAVDEFDLGLVMGTETLYLLINVTAVTGTSPTMTPTLATDDNTSFSSATTVWTAPAAITAVNTYVYPLPKIRERYAVFKTGTIGGSSTPGLTFTVAITPFVPSGLL